MPLTRDELKDYLMKTLKRIAPEADLSRVQPDKNLRRQMKIDSIDFLKIVLIIHDEKGVTVPEQDYRKLFTLTSMLDYFSGKF